MPEHSSASERIALLLSHVPSPRLRAILDAARDAQQRSGRDPSDPLAQRAQIARTALLMRELYGENAPAQARKVALRFGNGTFARMVERSERDASLPLA